MLIKYNSDTKQYEVDEEAKEYLNQIESPLGVLSIGGMYRDGKSYLLNQILGIDHAFEVGHTIRDQTKGIWIWSKPMQLKKGDKTIMNVVVMDTEGICSIYKDNDEKDVHIFILNLLLSSCFMFNTKTTINSASMSSLNFMTNLSKHFVLNSEKKNSEGANLK